MVWYVFVHGHRIFYLKEVVTILEQRLDFVLLYDIMPIENNKADPLLHA